MSQKFKIKKGDNVIVTTGRDKGRTGEVLEVIPAASKLKVQGVNMVKRHRRATQTNPVVLSNLKPRFIFRTWPISTLNQGQQPVLVIL